MVPRHKNFINEIRAKIHKNSVEIIAPSDLVEVLVILLLGFIIFRITLKFALPEQLSDFFRHGYSFWLIPILIVLFLSYQLSDSIRQPVNLILIIVLFTLPLTALWREGYAEMQIFGGLLSFSDSVQYYHEANRVLAGFPMTSFGARHPNAPALLASLLALTGNNLKQTLEIFVFLIALGVFLSATTIKNSYGNLVASIYVLLAFLFYRRFIGMTDTENLGFLMGCLAFALLLLGAKNINKIYILIGLLFSSFALNTRPGTYFILPTLLIWTLTTQKIRSLFPSRIDKIKLITVITIPFLLNFLLANAITIGGKGLFSNFSYTLYGITDGGSGWEQIFQDHPEINQMPDSQMPNFAYQLAYQNIKDNPHMTLKGIGNAYIDFFSFKDSSVFGFVCGGDLTTFNNPKPQNVQVYQTSRILLMIFSLSGISWLWFKRSLPENSLLLWGIFGISLSIPFLPPRDAGIMRVYATSIPFIILLPGLGLKWLISNPILDETKPKYINLTGTQGIILGLILIGLTTLGPLAIQQQNQDRKGYEISCSEGQASAIITVRKDSYLYLVNDESLKSTNIPQIRESDFQLSFQQFPHADMIQELLSLTPPELLMNAVDLSDGKLLWVIIAPEALTYINTPITVCGYWMPAMLSQGLGFLYAQDYQIVE